MRMSQDRGVERRFGRLLYGRLRAHGLAEVGAEGRLFMWRGGSSDVSLRRTNFKELRGSLLDSHSITEKELEQDSARLDDPNFMAPSPIHVDGVGTPAGGVRDSSFQTVKIQPSASALNSNRLRSKVERHGRSPDWRAFQKLTVSRVDSYGRGRFAGKPEVMPPSWRIAPVQTRYWLSIFVSKVGFHSNSVGRH